MGLWRGTQRWTLTGSTRPGPGGAGAPAAASRSVHIPADKSEYIYLMLDNITAARARVLGAGGVRGGRGEDGARLPQRPVPGQGLQHRQVTTY